MTTSDRVVAVLIAIASVLMLIGFEQVMTVRASPGPAGAIISSRGEPFP